jgi:hypothetical protein
MDSFTFDAVVIAAVLLLTVASMGGCLAALIGEPTRRAYVPGTADKPAIESAADRYSEEETDWRRDRRFGR